ncbi:MAG: dTDP-4-dehydrorhamnose 3,5-epimerase family protein, partial [Clostridia bacterium]|nr:dTDP-4-dehydrorhamnose 3,5-epimerase family protein [Clostridia bacterium]
MDYAIDLRKKSPTYLKYVAVELSDENKRQLYIPRGFAHGVISLEDNTMIEYFADNPYSPENDRSIRYNDPDININWGIEELILSDKDKNAPFVKECDCNF